ncbi:MAG: hypothetical protein K6A44_02985 [bacterium]|nr:hypothetical protein [bacterium]
MKGKNYKHSNPIDEEKLFKNFVAFFNGFNKFFDNDSVDEIVKKEFSQEYSLLPLLVKARMYYDEN